MPVGFKMKPLVYLIALVLGVVWSGVAIGKSKPNHPDSADKFEYKTALNTSQSAIGGTLSNHFFTDTNGQVISLNALRGKPLVLSMVYTSCYAICPITVQHLSKVIEKARNTLGVDSFSVAVVGFDAKFDSPDKMAQFARKQGVDQAKWHILSADSGTIDTLAKELGFVFFESPNGFDHIVQATIIDASGAVYGQVYGETFETPLLVSPLLDLILGRAKPNQSMLDDLINKVRFFCTAYDPASDSYSFDYSLFLGMIIGGVIIIFITVFIVREYRYGKHRLAR